MIKYKYWELTWCSLADQSRPFLLKEPPWGPCAERRSAIKLTYDPNREVEKRRLEICLFFLYVGEVKADVAEAAAVQLMV